MVNALSIDLEEFFHADNLKQCWPPGDWDRAPRRSACLVPRLLDMLAAHGVRCTWFVLGWVAEREPKLLQAIAAAGHEVGCHTYSHQLIYEQTPDGFREDLLRATDCVEAATGVRPRVFRAPSFSITARSLWALDVLRECGYEVDSSIFPVARDLYGIPECPLEPHRLENGLVEFPLTVLKVAGRTLPVAGGGYARLLPNAVVVPLLRRVNREGRPVVWYCHPWEFDCQEPRQPIASRQKRFRHYVGRRSFWPLLQRLLRELQWGTVSEVAKAYVNAQ